MRRYVLRRLLHMLLVLAVMSVLVFAIIRLIPGDPAVVLLGPEGASPEAVRALRQELGLERPLAVQYLVWLQRVARGDLGRSFMSKMPVSFLVRKSLPATLHLAAAALLVALLISVPTGILAAVRPHSWVDSLCTSFALAGVALPGFWLGIMLVLVFAVSLGWFPTSGYVSFADDSWASTRSVVLPALALGVGLAAALSRFLRSGLLDVLGQDYVRTARAKGLPERAVVVRHGVRNSLLSVVTVLGLQLGQLLGGSIVIEQVFNWPGMGRLLLGAIQFRDYSIVQAVVLLVATVSGRGVQETGMPRVALVTGGSRGIGRAIALRLARDGMAVGVNYLSHQTEAEAVVHDIVSNGGRALALSADVGDAAQVQAMAERLASQIGPVDVLVNNAAVAVRGDLSDFDYSKMETMRRVNVDGLVHVTRAFVEGMKAQGWGRIVNLTSVAGLGTSLAGTTFYGATKAAVIALTRRFALELGPLGVTVNAIAPGFIVTEMSGSFDRDAIAQRAMMRRVGMPDDIAHTVSFLVSEAAGFITAQVLTVDGGRTDYIAHP